jgi:translation initiation factor IF-3
MPMKEALQLARELGLHLFITVSHAYLPTGKLMDYQKFKATQEAKIRDTKAKHHILNIQEIKLRFNLEESDYQSKLKALINHLKMGDKVKLMMILRGREMQKKEEALELLHRIINDAGNMVVLSSAPAMKGKSIIAILSPNTKMIRKSLYRSLYQQ